MSKDLKEISNMMDQLLNGEIERLEITKEKEIINQSIKRGYTPLTDEEKVREVNRGLTFAFAFECFNDYMLKNNLRKSTINTRNKKLRSFRRYLEEHELPILEVREKHLFEYFSTKKRLTSAKVPSSHLVILRAFFNYLKKDELIVHNPITKMMKKHLQRRSEIDNHIEALTNDRIKDLVMSYDTTRDNELRNLLIVLLMLETGITQAELAIVQLSDIYLKRKTISVYSKINRMRRNVCISDYTANILNLYLNRFKVSKGNLLLHLDKENALDEDAIYQMLRRKSNNMGFKISTKVLRNTYVIHQMRNGNDAYSLQELLGFTTARSLSKYRNQVVINEN